MNVEREGKTVKLAFAVFQLENDTLIDVEDKERALDIHAMVLGLLQSWKERKRILLYSLSRATEEATGKIAIPFEKWGMPSGKHLMEGAKHMGKSTIVKWVVGTALAAVIFIAVERLINIYWHP